MKEIKIWMHLQELKDKVRKYLPRVDGGYYFEIYFASNRVTTLPFRVQNEKSQVQIDQKIFIMNQCGKSIDFWLRTYKDDQFIASGEIMLSEINSENENYEINIQVESAQFAQLKLTIEKTENKIDKEIIIENDADCLRPPKDNSEELERLRLEEERRRKEAEELEAQRLEQARKKIITLTDFEKDKQAYF
ncbi:hypothetical protein PPERSA_08934 [Pseudocohnilembus persalinus]|uniref:Uncharacterized protein n=1 Tax=Pseudocohnilembus persalinus TaxID=266149 RepID=A0A0V0R2S6_PSEPJ|nr:hypothetical protein PPERSA_08934 [Pseudocohnilembus persalinus]|eukprot:KRX08830.1 hypothetical protein PPERSA_08934 [Pseudocohnilembus persalinus]